jgi:hypothetical protein
MLDVYGLTRCHFIASRNKGARLAIVTTALEAIRGASILTPDLYSSFFQELSFMTVSHEMEMTGRQFRVVRINKCKGVVLNLNVFGCSPNLGSPATLNHEFQSGKQTSSVGN